MSHTHSTILNLYKPALDDTLGNSLTGFNGNADILDNAVIGVAGVLTLAHGGSAKALTASNGGIVYSDADSLEILSGTVTAQKLLMSQSNVAPIWSTPTYPNASVTAGKVIRSDGTDYTSSTFTIPDTMAINTILYASTANILSALATGNSGILVTSAGGVPSIATDIPTAVTIGSKYIYRADGTDIPVADGGIGLSTVASGSVLVANALNTISALTWANAGTKAMVNTSGVLSMETVTGSGAPVLANTPTLITPVLGVATATSIAIGANILNTDEWAVLDGITANKTIDHSGVSIIDGNGITGGGNLTASRTLALTTLTSDWDIGNTRMIQADKIRARDADGLALYDDGGNGIFVQDGGNVGIGTITPGTKLHLHNGAFRITSGGENAYVFQGFTNGGANDNLGIAMHAGNTSSSPYLWIAVAGSSWGGPSGTVVISSGKNVGTTRPLWIYANDNLVPSSPNLYIAPNTNKVGINTITPSAQLAINGGLAVGEDADPGDNNLKVVGTATIGSMTTAGFVKNAVTTGLLSGGNALAVADIPAMTSAEFATKISDETGTDKVVFNTSPALITPTINGVKYLAKVKSVDVVVNTWYDAIQMTVSGSYADSSSGRLTVTVHARAADGYYSTGMRVYRIVNASGAIIIAEDGTELTYTTYAPAISAHAEAQVSGTKIQIRITTTGTAENQIWIGYNAEFFTLYDTSYTNLL